MFALSVCCWCMWEWAMWRCQSVLCQWVPVVRMVVRSAVNDRPPVSQFPHRLHNTRNALQDNTTCPLLDPTNYTHCQSSSAEKSSNRSKYKRWIFWDSIDSALLSSCKVDQTMLWNKFGFMLAFHIISETLVVYVAAAFCFLLCLSRKPNRDWWDSICVSRFVKWVYLLP